MEVLNGDATGANQTGVALTLDKAGSLVLDEAGQIAAADFTLH